MLTCIPQSLFNWNFQVQGAPSGPAALTFNWFTEQGTISLGGAELAVCKQGWTSGEWTLERDGQTYADARKPSAFFRSFDVHCGDTQLTVKAKSLFGRGYDLLLGSVIVGEIRPNHPFTRRSTVQCSDAVPELAQLFSFWLVVLTWRRAAKNNKQ